MAGVADRPHPDPDVESVRDCPRVDGASSKRNIAGTRNSSRSSTVDERDVSLAPTDLVIADPYFEEDHPVDDVALLSELTPTAERLLERHLDMAKEWFPHELVPWERARAACPAPTDALVPLDQGVRSALYVNLLTEDNLPYYFHDIERLFGSDGAWGTWVRRWTAEDGRHSIVIRDYLTVTGLVDPVELERARMAQVCGGVAPHPPSVADGFAYLALQELATRIAHHNTGKALTDEAGYEVMKRVAADENLHYLFYRDLVSAALEVDASSMVEAIERQIVEFEMPGVGIPGFGDHARAIARDQIYDLAIHHGSIVTPLVEKHWRLAALEGLSERAVAAVERIQRFVLRLGRVARRLDERRQR